ncbi:MAG: hydrogenase maturation protease [Candidatus Acidiferrales bacterium]
MPDLAEQLTQCLTGDVCLVGLGNADYGDDGFGVRLAEHLISNDIPEGIGCEHLVFLDAVEFGGAPGSVVFLNSGEMAARFPQISTHKISLSLLAKWAEANGTTKAWLLGVQPESLAAGQPLTATMETTLNALFELLRDVPSPQRREQPSATRPMTEVNA